MTTFEFDDYLKFLRKIVSLRGEDRGYRTRLAEALHVHPSYVTRLFDGVTLPTPDQAMLLSGFWMLAPAEADYFFWLVMKARAADPALKKKAEEKLARLKKEHEELGESLPAEKINPNEENEYYFSWVYSAVHICATVPELASVRAMAERLRISEGEVLAAARVLERMKLVEIDTKMTIRPTKNNLHLSNQSWMASLQHRNWRVAALERIGRPREKDFRYTGVHSLSREDAEALRGMIREFLIGVDRRIRDSKEETVSLLTVDFFEL